ncbi:MAG: hypothetical protein HUJ76_03430 [Parasporobacterium sp.]|nr:hypothetical protein [Parasporobacterium sp.]
METKKSVGFGFRGWMLVIFQFIAFVTFTVFTNYPLNILAPNNVGYPDNNTVSIVYTAGCIAAIVVQLIVSSNIGKVKSIKKLAIILGVISLLLALGIMLIPGNQTVLWLVVYGLECLCVTMYATFSIGILVGQWFPRRKGTVMGVATIAFPVANALIGFGFAEPFFGKFGMLMETKIGELMEAKLPTLIPELIAGGMAPEAAEGAAQGMVAGEAAAMFSQQAAFSTFLPFFIVCVIGLIIGAIFIKDYPEMVGAYRDNDKNLTPEIANKMMMAEIESKKTTCWKTGKTLASRDFWLSVIPMGLLLMFAVGMMTQTNPIIAQFPELDYNTIMLVIAACGIFGSWILGVLDTALGTKTAILISSIVMIVSGVLGAIKSPVALVISLCLLGIFMGASSNFTVSCAAQYWRREDFPSVFASVNSIANLMNAFGPMVIVALMGVAGGAAADVSGNAAAAGTVAAINPIGTFIGIAVAGVIATICIALFSPKHVKETDDKYRKEAGKPLDDALVGRK